jgi:glycosyltransferase involved in cell wall biosynthesis
MTPEPVVAPVSIIICAYTLDRWDDLRDNIASLRCQTLRPAQITLVIDHNPELLDRARAEFREVEVVANRHGQGASGSRNTGYERSTQDILVLLDDDTIAEPGWLAALLAPLARPDVIGTGGYLEPRWADGGPPRWLPPEFNWIVGCSYTGLPTVEAAYRNPISANMSVRKHVYEAAGGFAQELSRRDVGGVVTGTAEETEFAIRASRTFPGSVWMFVPSARVQHLVPAGRGTWAYFRRRCRLEGTSKAILTDLSGRRDGLAAEGEYVRSVLPRAFRREARTALRGDRDAALRAGTIVAGLLLTGEAYVRTRSASRWRR